MRRRRRYSTQAIGKTKNQTSGTGTIRIQPPANRKKFWKYLFITVLLVVAGYAVYEYIVPMFSQIKREMDFTTTIQNTTHEQPVLPVEKEPEPQLTPISKKIQVEVLNGCGEQGIAKILTDRLRQKGYDVVNSGNYINDKGKINWNVKKTKIIDQLKNIENMNIINAKELAELMDVDVNLIESYENSAPIADLTIIIGKDFTQLSIFRKD